MGRQIVLVNAFAFHSDTFPGLHRRINKALLMIKLLLFFLLFSVALFPQNVMRIGNYQTHVSDTVTVKLDITNSQQFVAFQADIQLPANFEFIDNSAVLTSRANGHILSSSLQPGNILRLLAFTLNQSTFNGDSGAVLNFKLAVGDSAGTFPLQIIAPIISNNNSQNILTGFSNGFVIVSELVTSVELTSFYGNSTDDGFQLFWTTATEVNNQGFQVERQIANSEWKRVAFIPGKGSSQVAENYAFHDKVSSYMKMNTISYRIKQLDFDGYLKYYGPISFSADNVPDEFKLYQNYPNPFNPSTKIGIYTINSTDVEFIITDISGKLVHREIRSLHSGYSEIEWDGKIFNDTNAPSGVYLYSIKIQDSIKTKKMVLLR